ncbi:hypothetical protein [Thiolapillus sp.]|uniref:hypothetical protein n=1 Tax=Thiolapillus sp. TaxID=2017437 RepID=UPI003AF69F4F
MLIKEVAMIPPKSVKKCNEYAEQNQTVSNQDQNPNGDCQNGGYNITDKGRQLPLKKMELLLHFFSLSLSLVKRNNNKEKINTDTQYMDTLCITGTMKILNWS